MKISSAQLEKRLEALEAVRGQSEALNERIRTIDIRAHTAEVYHDLHDDICHGKHTFYNLPGGRGSGKSSFVALELVYQIMNDPDRISNGLVIRKWAVTLRGSVFSQIQWAIDVLEVGQYWKYTLNPMQFTYITGQTIKLTGLDDPQKLKSLKPVRGYFRFLWLEEFSEITGEPELRNLQQSVLRGGARFTVFRSFNPPISSANWANVYINRPDNRSITLQTNYLQVPAEWLGQDFIDEAEKLKGINPRAYEHEYMGLPVGSGSEVFETLEVRRITDQEYEQQDTVYSGLDFGFSNDPACFLRVGYNPKTETIVIMDEIYKTHLSNRELAEIIKTKGFSVYGKREIDYEMIQLRSLIIADSEDPKSIADLRDHGLKVIPCTKYAGCVQYRIRWLQHRKIIVDPARTPNAARELQNYSYDVDKRTGEVLSSLPDKNNHSIDALAYSLDQRIYSKRYSA